MFYIRHKNIQTQFEMRENVFYRAKLLPVSLQRRRAMIGGFLAPYAGWEAEHPAKQALIWSMFNQKLIT